MSFSYIFRFQNSIQKKVRMSGHLERRSKYRKKRRGFPGIKKQFAVTENTYISRPEPKIIQALAKVNKSFEKIETVPF